MTEPHPTAGHDTDAHPHQAGDPDTSTADRPVELHRLCVFELDLTCGHCVTVNVNGWYPVTVSCCDRLGGAWHDGTYQAYASNVDFVRGLEERHEQRPAGAEREPLRLLARRDRTDDPGIPVHPWQRGSAGRFPAPVGGPIPDPRTATSSR